MAPKAGDPLSSHPSGDESLLLDPPDAAHRAMRRAHIHIFFICNGPGSCVALRSPSLLVTCMQDSALPLELNTLRELPTECYLSEVVHKAVWHNLACGLTHDSQQGGFDANGLRRARGALQCFY